MAIRSADMVLIILLGIAFIAVLGSGSMVKGLISGGLGLLISFIGYQAVTGVPRFSFGIFYLYSGVGLIPVILGLFALPEAIALAAKGGAIAAIARYRSIPIRYIGTGEGIDDLRTFDARSFVEALFV